VTRPRRRIFLAASVLALFAWFAMPVRASDPGLPAAWYYRPQQGGSVPLAPPESAGVPAGRLSIAFSGGLAIARSVIEVEVGAAAQVTLVIGLDTTRSVGTALATVVACPAAPGWVPADAAPWTSQPGFSCSPAVPVTIDPTAGTLTVTLDKIIPVAVEGRLSVLLTPAGDQQTPGPAPTPGDPGAPFSLVTLDRAEAFTVRRVAPPTPVATSDPAAPLPAADASPGAGAPALDTGPAPGALFVPGAPPDATAPSALEPAQVADLTALQPQLPAGRPTARRLLPAASVRPVLPRWVLPLVVFLATVAIGVPTDAVRRRNAALHRMIDAAELDVPALEVEHLTVTFGGVTAVQDVSFAVPQGQILGLIGPNGAGKTTILDAITGLVDAGGTVRLAGIDVTALDTSSRATVGLGRSFQDGRLFPSLTVTESIAVAFEQSTARIGPVAGMVGWGPSARNERDIAARVDELVDVMGLDAFRDKFLSELSTGSRRIVDLACMLAHGARVLLLDEPSSGIAQRETEALGPLLLRVREQLGCTIVLIEHDMPLITGIADRLIALEVGAVIADAAPADVVRDPLVVEAYLGTDRATVERSGVRT
jgi:ABC-type branched-subunit amino acid transport system ATPase component